MQGADAHFHCPVPGSMNMIPLFASLLRMHACEITGEVCSLLS